MKLGKSKKNTPGCLTNKAMAYIKNKPAMYGKPKMDGDPVKDEVSAKKTIRKTRKGLSATVKTVDPNIDKTGYKGTAKFSAEAIGSKRAGKKYKKEWLSATKKVKQSEGYMKFINENPGQREMNPEGVKNSLAKAKAKQKKYRNLMIDAHKGAKKAPKMYGRKKK